MGEITNRVSTSRVRRGPGLYLELSSVWRFRRGRTSRDEKEQLYPVMWEENEVEIVSPEDK